MLLAHPFSPSQTYQEASPSQSPLSQSTSFKMAIIDNDIIKLDQLSCSIDKFIEQQLKIPSASVAEIPGYAPLSPVDRSRESRHQPFEEEKGGGEIGDLPGMYARGAGGVIYDRSAVTEAEQQLIKSIREVRSIDMEDRDKIDG